MFRTYSFQFVPAKSVNDILNKLTFQSPEIVRYNLRALPNEIEKGISTSLLFSSWNAVTYMGQINSEKVLEAEKDGRYVKPVQDIVKKYDGLWFNDEILVIDKY